MKDYYKILGVEEEASEEEIRARWIELTKYYHPDLMKTEDGDEKVKEINEAYEILKDESTRFHYDFERDLKRSFIKKAHRRQAREVSVRKIVLIPSGIVVLLLIVSFILFRSGRVATPPGPVKKTEVFQNIDKGSKKVTASQTPVVKTDLKAQSEAKAPTEVKKEVIPPESKEMASLSPRPSPEKPAPQVVMKSEMPATEEVSREAPRETPQLIAKEIPKEVAKEGSRAIPRETPKQVAKEIPQEAPKEVAKEVPREVPKETPREVAKEVPKETPKEAAKEVPRALPKEIPKQVAKEVPEEAPKEVAREVPKETPREVAKEVPKETPKETAKEVPRAIPKEIPKQVAKEVPEEAPKEVAREVPKEPPKEAPTVTLHPGERLTMWTKGEKPVSSRIAPLAKEEEVKQFFSSYVDRYHRKDVEGLLSCFSSKAIQNRTDRSDAIRRFYTELFDQSQDLRYQIDGMKIEISQHRVDVKARFRMDQKLKRDGEEKVLKGNIRWVLVKEEGRLKISSLDY
jgi:curved DNA-binding protein CbpA